MREIDLVLHDWRNQTPKEREQALTDIREAAETFLRIAGESDSVRARNAARRGRALNIVASYFHFLEQGQQCEK